MATVAESLFGVTPESLQRQRQQQLRQEAMDFASISDPFQRANFAIYQGAGGLARGIGGLLGAQDPEMMRVTQRQALLQGVDPTSIESLQSAAQQAMEAKDFTLAQELAKRIQDMQVKQAQIGRDQAAAAASTATANRDRTPAVPEPIQLANLRAGLVGSIRTLKGQEQTPEVKEAIQFYQDRLDALPPLQKQGAPSELAKLLSEQAALDPIQDKKAYDAYSAKIKKLTTGKGIGGEIAEGLGPVLGAIAKGQSETLGKAGGTEVGKGVAAIEGKYTAKFALDDALTVLNKGIYAGGYGPMQEAVAKYTKGVIGSPDRLANTEEFRSYIGNVVIPRLQEFGGNDSVEELKYLRSVMAGETTLEPRAIKNILGRAAKNIERGIQRLERQSKEVQQGKPLSTGPVGAQEFTTRSGVKYTKE